MGLLAATKVGRLREIATLKSSIVTTYSSLSIPLSEGVQQLH